MAYRAEVSSAGKVRHLLRHDAGDMPSSNGQEDASGPDDGGQVLRRRPAGARTDEDLMSAMARELVEKAGVGESADAVWRELDHEREKVQPRPAAAQPEFEEDPRSGPRSSGRVGRGAGSGAVRHSSAGAELTNKETEEDRALADGHRNQCAAQSLRLSQGGFNFWL